MQRMLLRTPTILLAMALTLCLVSAVFAQSEHEEAADDDQMVIIRGSGPRPLLARGLLRQGAYLGVQLIDLTPELRQHFGVPDAAGVMVSKVIADSPAVEAGIQVGDIVSAADGDEITSSWELARTVGSREGGETIDLEIWREGVVRTLQATLKDTERGLVDIRKFHLLEDGLEGLPIELETGALNKAIERLNEELESPEWQERVRRFYDDQSGLMERIEMLEQRLRELERKLGELPPENS